MKTENKKPMVSNDYPESDISKSQNMSPDRSRAGTDKSKKTAYIKDMPEIVPARTGII